VIAHEVAHHVQQELGILGQANEARAALSQADSNRVSVMIELQADCLSGVWASRLDGILEPGDIGEAIGTAEVIGDDYLQARGGRRPIRTASPTARRSSGCAGSPWATGQAIR
jgi:predicted metalloprotease